MEKRRPFAGSGVGPQPSPTPPAITLGIDASNYSGAFTSTQLAALKTDGVEFVIVQAITGLDGVSYTTQQLGMCVAALLRVQGYIWVFPNETTASVVSRLAMFNGFPLEKIWLDVEQLGVTVRDVDAALALCDHYLGKPAGIYTGKWFFDDQHWSTRTYWADRELWDSHYDNVADPSVNFVPYGGWVTCAVKQYAGTSTVAGIPNVDLNAAR